MKINKPNIIAILFVILYISLFFLPNMIDLIPDKRIKFIIAIALNSLVLICLIFETYKDITKKLYTVTPLIVAIDIVVIIAFIALVYTSFKSFDRTNISILLQMYNINMKAVIIFFAGLLLNSFLKRESFRKKIE